MWASGWWWWAGYSGGCAYGVAGGGAAGVEVGEDRLREPGQAGELRARDERVARRRPVEAQRGPRPQLLLGRGAAPRLPAMRDRRHRG